jgi:phosphonate transport system substrate-binding protein
MARTQSCGEFHRRGLIKMFATSAVLGVIGAKGTAWAAGQNNDNTKVWRLAVVPQLTPVEMSRNWTPVVQALAAAGVNCELVVYPSIAQFESEFHQGRADILFINPYHMVMAKREKKYLPLLRDSRPLEGVLVVKSDGPVKTLEQLKDHRLSFPAPNAFAASLYIRSVLERQFHLPFEASYASTHRNAIRQVLVGDSAAAGVVKTTLEREPLDIQKELRVIYTTPPLSPHPVAVHPRVPLAVRNKITEVMLALAKDPATKSLMAAIQMPNPVLASYEQDYAPLEKLKIEKFVVTE